MAMSARSKWMTSLIADAFKVNELSVAEEVFQSKYKAAFDDFFAGVGPARIFVYYQTAYKINESGEI